MLRPLAGIRVLEIGDDVATAFGARLLADLGAEVIKLESPGGGSAFRRHAPFASEASYLHDSALFGYLNHGKRSATLDLTTRTGADLACKLAERCDLLIYEPSALAVGSGFDPAAGGWARRPATVATSPYGQIGDRAATPASPFVVQHAAGLAFHQASPVRSPETTPPVGTADREASLAIGLVVALASLWALRSVQGGRPGPLVDLSAEDALAYFLVEPFADWLEGRPVDRRRAESGQTTTIAGGLVWLLPCKDGAVLVSPREDHQWAKWMAVMGEPDWSRDAALCGDREVRKVNALGLQRRMAEWSAMRACREIFEKAQQNRVACYPISTARDLLANEQLRHRGFFSCLELDGGATVPVPGLPFQMTTADGEVLERNRRVRIPALGEASRELLNGLLHLQAEDIDQLKRSQAL